jgi:hypothetical protein
MGVNSSPRCVGMSCKVSSQNNRERRGRSIRQTSTSRTNVRTLSSSRSDGSGRVMTLIGTEACEGSSDDQLAGPQPSAPLRQTVVDLLDTGTEG